MFPVHTWLADTTEKATTGTSVLLVCILDKIGTFGMLRFCLELLPDASRWATPVVVVLALISIVYGALVAIGQDDMLRLIGLTSLSHFGLIVLGIFVLHRRRAAAGAILYMVNHGIATAALFLIAGFIIRRRGTALISGLGGVEKVDAGPGRHVPGRRPRRGGLPGLSPFVSEMLVIISAFDYAWWAGAVAVTRDRARRRLRPLDVPAHMTGPDLPAVSGVPGPRPPRGRRRRAAAAGAGAVRLLPAAAARRDQPDRRHDPDGARSDARTTHGVADHHGGG